MKRSSSALQLTDGARTPRPFLKWAGGKAQLLAHIFARFPQNFGRYHEPFLGGGAVFFGLAPQRATLSDVNADLIRTYLAVRDNLPQVMQALQQHEVSEEHYYRVRALQSDSLCPIQSAARTIFLNRTCFNGLYRVNRSGQFNVPYGRYNNPTICNQQNLLAASRALQKVNIRCESALQIARRVRRHDLVYFDPPYDPLSRTSSFTSYAKLKFGRDEQAELADLFKRLANRGVHVVLSNSNTPFIRQLYRDCRIRTVHARRAINSRADRRQAVAEVIITAE